MPGHIRGILTDAQIERYALRGFYGEAARLAAESRKPKKRKPKKQKTEPKDNQTSLQRALALLRSL